MKRLIQGCAIGLALCLGGKVSVDASERAQLDARPPLRVHQGQYFRYSMPSDWKATETTNGVDMQSPDGVTIASFALLLGGFGHPSPADFLNMVLSSSQDFQSSQVIANRPLPSQPGPMGLRWDIAEIELRYKFKGTPVHAHYTVGVMQGWGQYSAFIRAYQSAEQHWDKFRYWLPAVAETVVITNARQVAGQDQVVLPGPIPHDYIYGDYNNSWDARQKSLDRIYRNQHEATMGYERSYDPQTGRHYDMPYELYDPSLGGYRNPQRPNELLERAPLP
ncbi:hypothetical protein O5O45_10355 [Hahella aquimaris]|uniref:hypothetical protein n=1 Tax=Hahella sp. HNIBRBA332 TaxID=3015983 RepID=UPI00273C6EF5|nr:hypothetical protein [Hahella sp. HNIBRBA332]WLQ16318.1 hypothetical protein O5O45_10355 [Hahella sp. HNIBRBA332]